MRRWVRWLLALLAWGLTRDARRLPSMLEGREAPPFDLVNLYEGRDSVSLGEFAGKVVVINFWASWCQPCVVEHPILVHLTETYDPEDVVVLGVLFQDTPDRGQGFIKRLGGDWRMAIDPGSLTAIRYGVYGVPETFFVGADGRVALRHDLALTWNLVTHQVDSLLAARGPRPKSMEPLETATSPSPD